MKSWLRKNMIKCILIGVCLVGLLAAVITIKGISIRQKEQFDEQASISLQEDIHFQVGTGYEQVNLWVNQQGVAYGFLPGYANLKDCKLTYSSSEYALSIDGTLYQSGDALTGLQLDKKYILEADINGEQQTLPVILMQSANINTMYISTASGSMDMIHEVKGNEETGQMTLYTSGGEVVYQDALEQIRGRGNNTWYNEKKAYQIKLTDKINLLNMGSAKTWILLAGAADGSGIRNKIVFDMAKKADIPFAQNAEFVDLYLNGEYAGLYLLTEKIQVKKNRIEITDLEKENEKMNPEMDYTSAEKFVSADGNQWGIAGMRNPEDITGGYLIERDNYFEEEPSAFRLTSGEKFSISSPQYATEQEVAYIAEVMQHIENAILAEDGIDPETGKNYKDLIDFDGLVYKYLFDEVMKCDDGWRGSNYFYKDSDTIDSKVYLGPLWDYDLSLGNAPEWFVGDDMPQGIIQTRLSVWYDALWKKEEFRQAVLEQYHTFFRPYMESLIAENGDIDAYAALVHASAKMNAARWQDKVELNTIYNSYEEQIAYLKYFIKERLDYIDAVWDEGAVYHEVLFEGVPKLYDRTDKYEYQYILDGECARMPATPTKLGYRFRGWYYEGTEEAFSPYQPVWSDTTLVALWEPAVDANAVTQNTEKEGNMIMIAITLMLLFMPAFITLKIAGKLSAYQNKGELMIDYGIASFAIFIICYGILVVLGSAGISAESLQSITYVIKYAVMAAVVAVALGFGVRFFSQKKNSEKQ